MNWEGRALQFINETSRRNGDVSSFLSGAIAYLGKLSGAFTAFQIRIEDAHTARVTDATPDYLNGIILDPSTIQNLIQVHDHKVIYWKNVAAQQNIFEDVLMAIPSAAFIPVAANGVTCLFVLGWTDNQSFDPAFSSLMEVVQVRLQEIIDQTSKLSLLQADRERFYCILESMPQAVVFIDNNNYLGWTNKKGSEFLHIDSSGQHELSTISTAMNRLRESLINKDEVNKQASEIFSDTKGDNWKWQMMAAPEVSYSVSCRPIAAANAKGMVWVFHEMSTHPPA
jgi:hypothetical protein